MRHNFIRGSRRRNRFVTVSLLGLLWVRISKSLHRFRINTENNLEEFLCYVNLCFAQ